jgi:hypothetical protein
MQTPLPADQVLCIDRKGPDYPVKERQAAFVNRFATGCNGTITSLVEARRAPLSNPWCIRGMKFALAVAECIDSGRTLYYIDNGYFGNWDRKNYFRIIKDNVHDVRPVIARDRSRLDPCHVVLKDFAPGRKILIAPPSTKSFSMWAIDQDQWIADTVAEIKRYTDRPIEIRMKRTRNERMAENTMEEALADDVHCLVTYNSVAAVEAVMLGKPAICLGPNAASVVSSTDLSQVENLKYPTEDEREAWLRHLSYSQFTFTEMSDGTAWKILNPG